MTRAQFSRTAWRALAADVQLLIGKSGPCSPVRPESRSAQVLAFYRAPALPFSVKTSATDR